MKTQLLTGFVLSLALVAPFPVAAGVQVHVDVSLPALVLGGPPEVVVIPGTYVYVIPDLDVDVYFYDGWWWRPWRGQWYRSRRYDTGWVLYRRAPSFYRTIPPGWRHYYSDSYWEGHRWNYERIPARELSSNWKTWASRRHWERDNNWGVQGYNPRTRRALGPGHEGRGRGPRK